MCHGRKECRPLCKTEFERLKSGKAMVLVIDNRVYDVTNFMAKHPGGELAFENVRGKDATVQFNLYHPEFVRKYLPAYCVGRLSEPRERTQIVKDYFAMRDKFAELGFFETDPRWEYLLMARILLLLAASVYCVLGLENPWARSLLGAFFMGLFWQQQAFIGHDLGHSAVTHSRKMDHGVAASIGDALLGISIGWWKLNHNTHHLVTNSVVDDPDIQHMPLFAVTEEFFDSPFSTYYEDRKPMIRFIMRIQHLLFYPIMCFARFYLYVKSFEHLLGLNKPKERRHWRYAELASLCVFWVWFLALAMQLPGWGFRLGFVLLCHAVSGLLHVQICLSHFPMAICDYKDGLGTDESDDAGHFIRSQIQSTMDVDCYTWMDWLHGGLQFQLVHHLFPLMPRHHLRSAVPHVAEFCKRHGLVYTSLSFIDGNVKLYNRLKDVAAKAKDWQPAKKQ